MEKSAAATAGDEAGEGLSELEATLPFASRYFDVPTTEMREQPLPAAVAKQLVEDERMLDSNPRLNLDSIVTTWMEPEATELMTKVSSDTALDDQDATPFSIDLLRANSARADSDH